MRRVIYKNWTCLPKNIDTVTFERGSEFMD